MGKENTVTLPLRDKRVGKILTRKEKNKKKALEQFAKEAFLHGYTSKGNPESKHKNNKKFIICTKSKKAKFEGKEFDSFEEAWCYILDKYSDKPDEFFDHFYILMEKED